MERRLHTRHRARTTVYVVMSGRKSRICKAKNLSANGVFVDQNLHLVYARFSEKHFAGQAFVSFQHGPQRAIH